MGVRVGAGELAAVGGAVAVKVTAAVGELVAAVVGGRVAVPLTVGVSLAVVVLLGAGDGVSVEETLTTGKGVSETIGAGAVSDGSAGVGVVCVQPVNRINAIDSQIEG